MIRFQFAACVAGTIGLATITTQILAQSENVISSEQNARVVIEKKHSLDAQERSEIGVPNVSELVERRLPSSNDLEADGVPTTYSATIEGQDFTVVQDNSRQEAMEAAALRTLIDELNSAKNDLEKQSARAKIKALLEKQFERDLQRREAELKPIEERVNALRKQLEKRKAAKDDILNTRVMTIVLKAEGLGFPGEEGADKNSTFQSDLVKSATSPPPKGKKPRVTTSNPSRKMLEDSSKVIDQSDAVVLPQSEKRSKKKAETKPVPTSKDDSYDTTTE